MTAQNAGRSISVSSASPAVEQISPPLPLVRPEPPSGPPIVLTLQDALDRANQYDAQLQAAAAEAEIARGDRVQAKAGLLPALSHTTQYLGNSPNGVNPNGRFVSLDGVKMYRSWAVVHQEVSANLLTLAPVRKAQAAEAAAQARLEVARRGLAVGGVGWRRGRRRQGCRDQLDREQETERDDPERHLDEPVHFQQRDASGPSRGAAAGQSAPRCA